MTDVAQARTTSAANMWKCMWKCKYNRGKTKGEKLKFNALSCLVLEIQYRTVTTSHRGRVLRLRTPRPQQSRLGLGLGGNFIALSYPKVENGCLSCGLIKFTLMLAAGEPHCSTRSIFKGGLLAASRSTAFEGADSEVVTIDGRSSIVHCYSAPFHLL